MKKFLFHEEKSVFDHAFFLLEIQVIGLFIRVESENNAERSCASRENNRKRDINEQKVLNA